MSKSGGNHKRLAAMEQRVAARIDRVDGAVQRVNKSIVDALRIVGQLGDKVRHLERRVDALAERGHVSVATHQPTNHGTPMVCGGGARCPAPDHVTDRAYAPIGAAGPIRCEDCAIRLGWISTKKE